MKKLCALFFFVMSIPLSAVAGDVRIIDFDESSVTVEILIDRYSLSEAPDGEGATRKSISVPGFMVRREEGMPLLPFHRYIFAVTSAEGVRVDLLETETEAVEGFEPSLFRSGGEDDTGRDSAEEAGMSEGAGYGFVTLSGIGEYRKGHLALVDVRPVIYDGDSGSSLFASRLLFRLTFPPLPLSNEGEGPRFGGEEHIVNARQSVLWKKEERGIERSPAAPFEFSRSGNWVKLGVEEKGLYRVSYSDLLNEGVSPSLIDPSTVRVFSGGYNSGSRPFQQPERVSGGGSFEASYGLSEHSIMFVGDQPTFDPGEYFVFFGVGVEGWLDYLYPDAARTETYENIYETGNIYFMTWNGSFDGNAERMSERSVTPGPVSPDMTLDRYEERIHREFDLKYLPVTSDDRWGWYTITANVSTLFDDTFEASDIVGPSCRVRTIGFGESGGICSAYCFLNGENIGLLEWAGADWTFAPDSLDATASSLEEGENTLTFTKTDIAKDMKIYWYEVYYDRYLKPYGSDNTLDFFAPGTTGTARFILDGFTDTATYIFDVTDYLDPVVLTGAYSNADSIIFDDLMQSSGNHYYTSSQSGFMKPDIDYEGGIPSLREEVTPPEMVVIYNALFTEAAEAFAAYRSSNFPFKGSGYVKAVDIEDVYNNFSGGLKDPIAIRNYLKYLYDNYLDEGSPVIEYVMLWGKGNHDPKNVFGRGQDYIPFYFIKDREIDDHLIKLDDSDDVIVDIALGRLPAIEKERSEGYVDKLKAYEASAVSGSWTTKGIFIADDEFGSTSNNEFWHMEDSEEISSVSGVIPDYIDVREIYLHDYPFKGSTKPDATEDLLSDWNKGALLINFFGHGSAQQFTDELVLRTADLFSLSNGPRFPLLLAFSCTVGDLDQIYITSLAHEAVLLKDHGAIAAIAAVALSMPTPNKMLDYYFLDHLFPSEEASGTETVGKAFLFAKMTEYGLETNNQRYALLGDPSMRLVAPAFHVEHDIEEIDTLKTGHRYSLSGSVVVEGAVQGGYSGEAEIIVQEAKEQLEAGWVEYDHEGSTLYKGTADVSQGRFSAEFIVPLRCRLGEGARVRSYVSSESSDGAGAYGSIDLIQGDDPVQSDGPPRVNMFFENMATKVKKGSRLIVDIQDDNGIAILGRDPQNSILLEFDDSGYPIYVTDYFEYDHNSYTSGRVEYPLNAGFEEGEHSVVTKVFDNLGEMAEDTLSFEIIEEGIFQISDVFNFPNPFRENTNFVFQLTANARIHLKVFNVSGVMVWERKLFGTDGFNSIFWDGRDYSGSRLANGTYLYVIDAEFYDSVKRKETIEGKVVLLR